MLARDDLAELLALAVPAARDLKRAGRLQADAERAIIAAVEALRSVNIPEFPLVSGLPGRWITTDEAGERLAITDRAIRGLAARGALTARRRGRLWEIDPQSVEERLARKTRRQDRREDRGAHRGQLRPAHRPDEGDEHRTGSAA